MPSPLMVTQPEVKRTIVGYRSLAIGTSEGSKKTTREGVCFILLP